MDSSKAGQHVHALPELVSGPVTCARDGVRRRTAPGYPRAVDLRAHTSRDSTARQPQKLTRAPVGRDWHFGAKCERHLAAPVSCEWASQHAFEWKKVIRIFFCTVQLFLHRSSKHTPIVQYYNKVLYSVLYVCK